MMEDNFDWLKPRHLFRLSKAIRQSTTYAEERQFKRIFRRGLQQWIATGMVVVISGLVVLELSSPNVKTVLARLTQ